MPDDQRVPTPDEAPKAVTMTQEALDALIAGRLARQQATFEAKYGDYDAIKADLTKHRQDAESEADRRIREAVEAAKTEALAQADTRVAEVSQVARTRLLEAEIRAEAVAAGFAHPEDVVDKLRGGKDIEITADLVVKGVARAVKALAEERPSWLKARQGSFTPTNPGAQATQAPVAGQQPTDRQAIEEARRRVLPPDLARLTRL